MRQQHAGHGHQVGTSQTIQVGKLGQTTDSSGKWGTTGSRQFLGELWYLSL